MRRIAAAPASRNVAIEGAFFANVVVLPPLLCLRRSVGLSAILSKIKAFLRNVFAHETLDEAPISAAPKEPRRRFATLLLGKEPLSVEPEASKGPRGAGLVRILFAPEPLPEDPPAPPARSSPGPLALLFAPERLDELPPQPGPRARRAHWLRWLFRFERLDPP